MQTSPESPAPVRSIANAISGWVDRLGAVWVEGQVAQVSRRPGLQTVFMTLRDSVADISVPVTCSRTLFDGLNPPLVEGASVLVHAKPSYYANRGTLSLQAREIRMVGLGELLAQLERRRQLLAAEGLFESALKRPLPFLPTRVGLITAPKSAAERDVLDNATRRWPGVEFEVVHATMQGQRAAAEVIGALERLDHHADVDVIVIARGGGSVEDLLPFSDEGLIRAVAKARTPVVSAIGHEPDTPLLDLVADVRASTPTDAAKLIVPDVGPRAGRGRPGPAADPAPPGALAGPRAVRPRGAPLPTGPGRPAVAGRRPARGARRVPRPLSPYRPARARPRRRRHRPPTRPGASAVAVGHAAAGILRPAGRRRARRHHRRGRRGRRRRERPGGRRPGPRHHHPHRTPRGGQHR